MRKLEFMNRPILKVIRKYIVFRNILYIVQILKYNFVDSFSTQLQNGSLAFFVTYDAVSVKFFFSTTLQIF